MIPAIALTVFSIAGVVGIESTFAQEDDGRSSIIEKIASTFNLSEDEVQNVFDEHREERQAERQAEKEAKLDELVSEGKLTEDQKNLIIAKMEERRAEKQENREEFQNMSREERREAKETHKAEMEAWFEENGIDQDLLKEVFGKEGKHRGGKHGFRR